MIKRLNSLKTNEKFLMFFLILSFIINIPIPYFQSINNIDLIYKLLQCIMFAISLFHFKKISKIFVVVTLYYLIYFVSTCINGGTALMGIIRAYVVAFNLIVLMQYYIEKNKNLYFKSGKLFFIFILLIQLLTIIFFKDGIYDIGNINPYYFLGHRNDTIEYILPAMTFCCISNILDNKKGIISILFCGLSLVCVILTWSVNSIIALLITIMYIYFPFKKFFQNHVKYIHMFFMSVGLFFSFIIFNLQKHFEWFITGIFHKNLTFSNRTKIWEKAIEYIQLSPLYGYGNESIELKKSKIYHPNSCHNYFLDFMYTGGILMLGLMIYMVFITWKKLKKVSNNKCCIVLTGVFSGYFLIWFATPIHLSTISYMFLVFAIANNIEKLYLDEQKN